MKIETTLKRLNHALWVMKQLPKEKLNMQNWVTRKHLKEPCSTLPDNFKKFDCRTAACFLGAMGLDKTCRKEGLKTDLRDLDVKYVKADSPHIHYYGIDAAEAYFGITRFEAFDLTVLQEYKEFKISKTDPSGYKSVKPKDVIRKLKEFIDRYEIRNS